MMKYLSATAFAVLIVVFNCCPTHGRHPPEDPIFLLRGQKSNLTYSERLTALTRCLENKGYPPDTIRGLRDLFAELKGRTDGFYLVRAAEFIGDDYLRGKNCVCRGIYSSAGLGTAKHCFTESQEVGFMLDLCLARFSRTAAKLLPKECGVSSFTELRHCCRSPETWNLLN